MFRHMKHLPVFILNRYFPAPKTRSAAGFHGGVVAVLVGIDCNDTFPIAIRTHLTFYHCHTFV